MWLYYGRLEVEDAISVIGRTEREVKTLLWEDYKKVHPRQYWPEEFRSFQDVSDYFGSTVKKVKVGEVFGEND